jgi:hypothetical protein
MGGSVLGVSSDIRISTVVNTGQAGVGSDLIHGPSQFKCLSNGRLESESLKCLGDRTILIEPFAFSSQSSACIRQSYT